MESGTGLLAEGGRVWLGSRCDQSAVSRRLTLLRLLPEASVEASSMVLSTKLLMAAGMLGVNMTFAVCARLDRRSNAKMWKDERKRGRIEPAR
jgi:hypothetical protein